MIVLRYVYVLALVVWLGGLLVAGGIVAPSVFAALELASPAEGGVLAGHVFGEVLRRVHLLAYAAGGAMLLALTLQRFIGARPKHYGIRAAVVAIMLAGSLVSGRWISPRVEAIAARVATPIASLPETDATRTEFYRWHGMSNLLLAATAAGGLVLLGWEARE